MIEGEQTPLSPSELDTIDAWWRRGELPLGGADLPAGHPRPDLTPASLAAARGRQRMNVTLSTPGLQRCCTDPPSG